MKHSVAFRSKGDNRDLRRRHGQRNHLHPPTQRRREPGPRLHRRSMGPRLPLHHLHNHPDPRPGPPNPQHGRRRLLDAHHRALEPSGPRLRDQRIRRRVRAAHVLHPTGAQTEFHGCGVVGLDADVHHDHVLQDQHLFVFAADQEHEIELVVYARLDWGECGGDGCGGGVVRGDLQSAGRVLDCGERGEVSFE